MSGGYFYWGEKNNPNRSAQGGRPARPRSIPVSGISYGHTPDKRAPAKGYERKPIDVEHSAWGGYRVIDGNARLQAARQRGDRSIRANVHPSSGCLGMLGLLSLLAGLVAMVRRRR